jgi:uncharacterized SAM-binding protein YcdF (DUF218 family)
MGFLLKKWLGAMLMPLSLVLVLLSAGLLLYVCGRRGLGRSLIITGTLLLLVASNHQTGIRLVAPLENRFEPVPELTTTAPLPPALAACELIAVLGGGHATADHLAATARLSSSALARLVEAVRLARALPNATVLVCGPPDEIPGYPSHAAVLRDAAISLGLPASRIRLLTTGRDTAGEIEAITTYAEGRKVALVTSAWHLPRATAMARKSNLNVLPCPTDYLYRPPSADRPPEWTWSLTALERTSLAIREYLGLAWSRLRGQT